MSATLSRIGVCVARLLLVVCKGCTPSFSFTEAVVSEWSVVFPVSSYLPPVSCLHFMIALSLSSFLPPAVRCPSLGPIPPQLGALQTLSRLDLSNNRLSGELLYSMKPRLCCGRSNAEIVCHSHSELLTDDAAVAAACRDSSFEVLLLL